MADDLYLAEQYRDAWFRLLFPELGATGSQRGLGPTILRDVARAVEFEINLSQHPTAKAVSALIDQRGPSLIQQYRGVTGVALSLRYEKGEIRRNEPCLTFYVESEEAGNVPPTIDNVPTNVVVAGKPVLQLTSHQPGTRARPAQPGCSISHVRVPGPGTLGCIVEDSGGTQYVLSCAHVLSDGTASVGDSIVQPASSDGGTAPADEIAKFTRALPLSPAVADAAIAEISSVNAINAAVQYLVQPVGTRTLSGVGVLVQKSGNQTGLTLGIVVGIHGTIGPLLVNGVSNVYFSNAIVANGISEGGDSGSLMMDYQNRAIGLIFGGLQYSNSCGQMSCVASWSSPIDTVLSQLSVRLV